jgi:hypothetical protein
MNTAVERFAVDGEWIRELKKAVENPLEMML